MRDIGRVIEASEHFPESLLVDYATKNGEDLSLAIPLNEEAFATMRPFLKDPMTNQRPTGNTEGELGKFFKGHAETGYIWVNARKNFIKARMAPVGEHYVTLAGFGRYYSQKNTQERVTFYVETREGWQASWTAPYKVEYTVGSTPDQDTISTPGLMWSYLEALGLDQEKFAETIGEAPALWPREQLPLGGEAKPLFSDPDNIMPELHRLMLEYGLNTLKIKVTMDKKYGLGVERQGQYHEVKYYLVEGAQPKRDDQMTDKVEFEHERKVFDAQMDILVKLVSGKDSAVFYDEDGKETQDAVFVILNVLVPVVNQYPHVVTRFKPNGEPATTIPPTPDSWNLDGLVATNLMVERLNKLGTELANPAGLVDKSDHTRLLEWVSENVSEFDQAEGGVY